VARAFTLWLGYHQLWLYLYSIVKVLKFHLHHPTKGTFVGLNEYKLASPDTSMLYKRAFRKEKEVITFLEIRLLRFSNKSASYRLIILHCHIWRDMTTDSPKSLGRPNGTSSGRPWGHWREGFN